MNNIRRSELLIPAGSLDKLKIAILYGADAVYAGTPDMSLRTRSAFSLEELVEGIEFAHAHGKKVYLTLNLFSHNKDIEKLPLFIDTIKAVKPDGLIVADPGIFHYIKTTVPELELHVSTQANVCSWVSVNFWKDLGASLCVLAREVSYPELVEIRERCQDIKLEAFVHGSMCMAYSGRCLLSNFMSERGANQGNCSHSCRWSYKVHMKLKDGTVKDLEINEDNKDLFEFFLEEEFRPSEYIQLVEDERGSYLMNAKDLCLMPKLDDYLKIGVDSLKIEGRNKSQYYVASVTRAYRKAIDDWYKNPESWKPDEYMKELEKIPNRGYTMAFHDERLTNISHNYENTASLADWEFAGIIVGHEDDALIVEVKNYLEAGDVLEFMPPDGSDTILLRIYEFYDMRKQKTLTEIHSGTQPRIRIPFSWFDQEDIATFAKRLPVNTVLRKERSLKQEQIDRLKLDREALNIELGKGSLANYDKKKDALIESTDEADPERHTRIPRVGTSGCCGKGCNGCLIFWHDPIYEKARNIMKNKKMGVKLTVAESQDKNAA